MGKRQILIGKIRGQGYLQAGRPRPVVSLEDFFEGNEDPGSIGCNLLDHPGVQRFYDHLRMIRSRPDVQDVLIEITEVDEESSWEPWPFSERVYILTEASAKEVLEWMALLQPDEIETGYIQGKPPAAPELAEGMRVYGLWWD
jgi:hypothetical protein